MIAANSQRRKMHSRSSQIEQPEQLEQLKLFLQSNKLPFKDVNLTGNIFLLYYDDAGNIVGSAGLESYGDAGLIRSVAVHHAERGKGLGIQIVDEILLRAMRMNLKCVFLLTETAHEFFLKKGFQDVSRDDVPASVKASSEFSLVCPASAKCMVFKF